MQTELTYAGEVMVGKVEKILSDFDELAGSCLDQEASKNANVAVAINTLTLYPELCNEKMFELPITLSEHRANTCFEFAVAGHMDMSILARIGDMPSLCTSVLIISEPIMYLCSEHSTLAERERLDVHDFAGHDVLLFPNNEFVYEDFLRAYNAHNIPDSRIREIASVSLMKNEVRIHDAIAIANSEFAIRPPSGLTAKPSTDPSLRWNLYALTSLNAKKNEICETIVQLAKQTLSAKTLQR